MVMNKVLHGFEVVVYFVKLITTKTSNLIIIFDNLKNKIQSKKNAKQIAIFYLYSVEKG